eukprot:3206113-Alexandrium_andersonii.AAC.1
MLAHGSASIPALDTGAAADGGSARGRGPEGPATGTPLWSTTAPSRLSQRRGASGRAAWIC